MEFFFRCGIYAFGLIVAMAVLLPGKVRSEPLITQGAQDQESQGAIQKSKQPIAADRRMGIEDFFFNSNNGQQAEAPQQAQLQGPQLQVQQTDPNSIVFVRDAQLPNPVGGGLMSRLILARRMLRLTRLMRRLRIIPRLIGLGLGRPLRQVQPGPLALFSNRIGEGYNEEYDPRDFVFGNKGFNYNNTRDNNEQVNSGTQQIPRQQIYTQDSKPYYGNNNGGRPYDSEENSDEQTGNNYESQLRQRPLLNNVKLQNEKREQLPNSGEQTDLKNLQQYHQLLRNLQELQNLQNNYYQPNEVDGTSSQQQKQLLDKYNPQQIPHNYQQVLNKPQEPSVHFDESQQLEALNSILSQLTREQQIQLIHQIQQYREQQFQLQQEEKLRQQRGHQQQLADDEQQRKLQALQQVLQAYQQPQRTLNQDLQQVQPIHSHQDLQHGNVLTQDYHYQQQHKPQIAQQNSHLVNEVSYDKGDKTHEDLYARELGVKPSANSAYGTGSNVVGVGVNIGIKPPAIDVAVTKPVSAVLPPLPQLVNPIAVKPIPSPPVVESLIPVGLLPKPMLNLKGRMFFGAEVGKGVKVNAGGVGR